jgi:RNA polymerase sigma-70 factor (ECF subfamily)
LTRAAVVDAAGAAPMRVEHREPVAAMSADGADDALLAAYAAGDVAAARMLTLRLAPRLIATAARLLGDRTEAEDVAQETMLRLWRIAPDWRPGAAQPATWAHRVAVNLCLDRLRRRPTRPLEEAAEVEDPAPPPLAALEAADRVSALSAALSALPDRQRIAICLRHFEERSNPEIAESLGISVEAVESLLSRGRRALSRALGAHAEKGDAS